MIFSLCVCVCVCVCVIDKLLLRKEEDMFYFMIMTLMTDENDN
jgi:hypothetical protein